MPSCGHYAGSSMGKASGKSGSAGAEAEAGRDKPIPINRRTASQLGLWRDAQDIASMQLDALVLLIIGALVLLPITWLWAGDLALMVAYVVIFSAISFLIIYVVLTLIDRRVKSIITSVGERRPARKK